MRTLKFLRTRLALMMGCWCLLSCLAMATSSAQEPAAAAADQAAAAADKVAPIQPAPAVEELPHHKARGLRLRPDGTLVGEVNYIDEGTLALRPVGDAIVTFMQNRRVVAQQRTNVNGEFAVVGLAPSAIYSVFVTSRDWFCAMSLITVPGDQPVKAANKDKATAQRAENQWGVLVAHRNGRTIPTPTTTGVPARLAAQQNEPAFETMQFLQIQMIPREDFVAALQSGVLGGDLGGIAPGGAGGFGPGGMGGAGGGAGGGAAGGGAGGGGGGAGGGLGGAGGLLGAAGVAAGVAGASSSNRNRASSPVAP